MHTCEWCGHDTNKLIEAIAVTTYGLAEEVKICKDCWRFGAFEPISNREYHPELN